MKRTTIIGIGIGVLLWGTNSLLTPVIAAAPDVLESHQDILRYYIGSVTTDQDTLADVLINQQIQYKQRRNIISHFCDAILLKKDVVGKENMSYEYFIPDGVLYDPRQSYLVYTLCVNLDEESQGEEFGGKSYIYRNYKEQFSNVSYPFSSDIVSLSEYIKEDADLNRIRGLPRQDSLDARQSYSPCDPKTSMQACNFSRFFPKIFTNIMNDVTNLRLAALYGYNYFTEDDSPAERNEKERIVVREFSESYFGDYTDPQSPCNDPNHHYLNSATFKGDKAHCSHPKTALYLRNVIRGAARLVKKTKLIDPDKVYPMECGQQKGMMQQYSNGTEMNKITEPLIGNISACAFSSYGSIFIATDMKAFFNLYLNELMWYSMFLDFYSNEILDDPSYSPLSFTSISETSRKNQLEAVTINYEIAIAKSAVFQTMRMLSHIYTTFPIHIGLQAYREDVVNYRVQLAKIYTPLHQLYYTFRNTQSCQE